MVLDKNVQIGHKSSGASRTGMEVSQHGVGYHDEGACPDPDLDLDFYFLDFDFDFYYSDQYSDHYSDLLLFLYQTLDPHVLRGWILGLVLDLGRPQLQ